MENKFKVGDLVRLKSGGPLMVITAVSKEDDEASHTVSVDWFNGAGDYLNQEYVPNACVVAE